MSKWRCMGTEGQSHSLTLVQGHSDIKIKTCLFFFLFFFFCCFVLFLFFFVFFFFCFLFFVFLNSLANLSQISYGAFTAWKNESLFSGLDHMITVAAMTIYGKYPSKLFSETKRPMTLKLDMQWDSSPTKFVQMMTFGWPWSVLRQGQFWSRAFVWKKA